MAVETVSEGAWFALPPGRDITSVAAEAARLDELLTQRFRGRLGRYVEVDAALRRARFRNVAGQLRLAGGTYLVRPKFMSQSDWPARLATWVAVGHSARPDALTLLPGAIDASSLPTGLGDLLALHYARLLDAAQRDVPLAAFARVKERRGAVRGRPLMAKNLTLPPHELHRPWYEFTSLDVHAPALRLLSWAAQYFRAISRIGSVRHSLRVVAHRLPTPPHDVRVLDLRALRLPPGAAAYREPLEIANALARGSPPGTASGSGERTAAPFAICTFAAFEGLVTLAFREVGHRLGMTHTPQAHKRLALRVASPALRGVADKNARSVRPDDMLSDDYPTVAPQVLVSDTKYVRPGNRNGQILLPEVRDDHLYQVLAAAIAHDARAAMLVQPMPEELPAGRAGVELVALAEPGAVLRQRVTLGVVRLDLRRYSDGGPLHAMADQLEQAARHVLARATGDAEAFPL